MSGPYQKGVKMALTTVYFKTAEGEIAKAIVDVKQVPFFEKMGANREPKFETQTDDDKQTSDASTEEIDEDEMKPDQGSGRPGSYNFHRLCVLELKNINDINDYLIAVTGIALDARIKKVEKAQKTAIKTIRDWLKENDHQNT